MGNLARSMIKSAAALPGGRDERMTYYTYTDTNRLSSVGSVMPDDNGAREQLAWSDSGEQTEDVSPSGKVIAYERDKMGNITGVSYGKTAPVMQLLGVSSSFETNAPAVTKV